MLYYYITMQRTKSPYIEKTSSYREVNTLQVGYETNGRMLYKEITGGLNRDHLKQKKNSL